jgi:hypothetical protein
VWQWLRKKLTKREARRVVEERLLIGAGAGVIEQLLMGRSVVPMILKIDIDGDACGHARATATADVEGPEDVAAAGTIIPRGSLRKQPLPHQRVHQQRRHSTVVVGRAARDVLQAREQLQERMMEER